jgi:hypothetical protein
MPIALKKPEPFAVRMVLSLGIGSNVIELALSEG